MLDDHGLRDRIFVLATTVASTWAIVPHFHGGWPGVIPVLASTSRHDGRHSGHLGLRWRLDLHGRLVLDVFVVPTLVASAR